MPLEHGKSKAAFVHNIKAEIKAGKPMKQSLAIAYSMKKRKKMAHGGALESDSMHEDDIVDRAMSKRKKYSEGGMIANGGEDELEHLADADPNEFDDLALRDHLESTNSGAADGDFLGNAQEDEDRRDPVARAMMKRKKQHNPRPA